MRNPQAIFLRLEQHNYNKKAINRLIIQDATAATSTDSRYILRALHKYCSNLYTTQNKKANESFYDNFELPKISSQHKLQMERVLDIDEIENVIRQLKSNKTPGTDGLPIEFYRAF